MATDREGASTGKVDADLVLVHGFWSTPATWDHLTASLENDPQLTGLRVHAFGYESPKLPRWWQPAVRVPDYDDIAQSLPAFLDGVCRPTVPVALVTHSQGGLIVQRFLAWMLTEGRGRELARIKLVVMLACPNEGSEFAASIRAVSGYNRHPQARDLKTLSQDAGTARRMVLTQVVNAARVDDRHCPIPIHVFAGRTDNVVTRQSAQSVFPDAEVLPGDHSSILDTTRSGNLTGPTIRRLILDSLSQAPANLPARVEPTTPARNEDGGSDDGRSTEARDATPTGAPPRSPVGASDLGTASRFNIRIQESSGIQVGDNNTQNNFGPASSQTEESGAHDE